MMLQTILIIEDEERIAHWVQSYFERAGFQTLVARDGLTGLDMALKEELDLIILDVMLPGLDGRDICKKIRSNSDVPIIMLTARDGQQDRIDGLEMGADDYVVKPFDPDELVARARSVLRRVGGTVAENLQVGEFNIHLSNNTCTLKGKEISLTKIQLMLLAAFMRYPNQILSRDQLLDAAFDNCFEGFDRSIDAHIRRLLVKIEPDPGEPQYLLTVYGMGYKFVS
jgi:DNA-binding response OmpR family regulator